MKIKDQIKVGRFKHEWHEATINVLYTNNWLTKELEKRASRKDITLQQFNVLRILRGQYPKAISNTVVKKRMISSTPDISRLVDRIVQKELVQRTKSSTDKRSVDLLITEQGLRLLEELEEEMLLGDILCKNISDKEALLLSQLLDKLRGE